MPDQAVVHPWKWETDPVTKGTVLVLGEKRYVLARGVGAAALEFAQNYDVAKIVYQDLTKARAAFLAGMADYDDAAERLGQLHREIGKAGCQLTAAVKSLNAFFDPPEVAQKFSVPELGGYFDALVHETIEQLTAVRGD